MIINIGQTQDRILQDFKIILETVLGQSHVVLETFLVLQRQDSERTALSFTCPTAAVQGPGRSTLIVQREQIEFLCELHFSWAKIAQILGISESTLQQQHELLIMHT